MIRASSSLSLEAARESRSSLRYSKGVLPVISLKIREVCHGEYPAACDSMRRVIGSAMCCSMKSCIRRTALTFCQFSVLPPPQESLSIRPT